MKGKEYSASSKSTIDSSPERARKQLVFTERSLYSDRYIFMENARKMGLVSELEYVIYQQMYDWHVKGHPEFELKGLIHLATPKEECLKVGGVCPIH